MPSLGSNYAGPESPVGSCHRFMETFSDDSPILQPPLKENRDIGKAEKILNEEVVLCHCAGSCW